VGIKTQKIKRSFPMTNLTRRPKKESKKREEKQSYADWGGPLLAVVNGKSPPRKAQKITFEALLGSGPARKAPREKGTSDR